MKLYDVAGSPNCKKVRVVARELGLPLELVPVDLATAREPSYLAQNRTGKVPTLVDDDGFVLSESGAIVLYLARGVSLPSHVGEWRERLRGRPSWSEPAISRPPDVRRGSS